MDGLGQVDCDDVVHVLKRDGDDGNNVLEEDWVLK